MKLLPRLWNALSGKPAATLAAAPGSSAPPLYRQVGTFLLFDWLAGVPDPDEVLRRTGRTRADLRQLMRDAEVEQALDTRREAVLATPWRLESSAQKDESAPLDEPTQFVLDELKPHIDALISNLWDAIPYGYSVVEAVYVRKAGRIGIDSLHAPPFEWFRPLPTGELRFFPQDGSGGFHGIECDPRKFLLARRNATYRNPYGEALLSCLYWPVTWRLQGWQLWLDFLETYGAPIIVGKTANYNAFVEAMQAQGIKRAVGWQPTAETEDIKAITASTAGEFERLEDALSRTIAKVVLGQTLTSDVGKTGSFAAAKVHDNVRDDKRRADLRIIIRSTQQLVNAIWLLNAFPGDPPKFCMQDDAGLERERADRDAILAGALGVRFTPDYIAERYDLETDDFTITDPAPVLPAQPPEPGGIKPRETVKQAAVLLRAGRFTPEQQRVEDAVAALLRNAPVPITVAELRSAIRAARDERDLAERLAVLIDTQDPAYADLLARAQFAANVLGYVHASETPAAP